jgi:hypothetical protein
MYEFKNKLERYLRVNLFGPGPRLMEKRIYRVAVSQRFRNIDLYRETYTRCRIDTINSPDDEHMAARNM